MDQEPSLHTYAPTPVRDFDDKNSNSRSKGGQKPDPKEQLANKDGHTRACALQSKIPMAPAPNCLVFSKHETRSQHAQKLSWQSHPDVGLLSGGAHSCFHLFPVKGQRGHT